MIAKKEPLTGQVMRFSAAVISNNNKDIIHETHSSRKAKDTEHAEYNNLKKDMKRYAAKIHDSVQARRREPDEE